MAEVQKGLLAKKYRNIDEAYCREKHLGILNQK
jgi:hypothetical protein